MIYYYGDVLSPNMTMTPEGFLICRNVPIARTGDQDYLARELQLEGDGERIVRVHRSPGEVFDGAAMASFEGKAVADDHPGDDVRPDNYASYSKGHVQNVHRDGAYMVADLHVTDPALIEEIRGGNKREVSCGYHCMYEPAGDGSYNQTRIRGNHVAVVRNGRAGKAVSIKDSAPAEQNERSKSMNKTFKEAFLSVFGVAAKDASPETMEQIARDAAAVLDAEPAAKAPEAEPTAAPVKDAEEAPGGDVGAKLDQLIALMSAFLQKEKAEPAQDETPEDALDALIGEMSGKPTGEQAQDEASGTIPADGEEAAVTSDALTILKNARPAIAAIKDPAERMKVTDALISAVRGSGMGELMKATQAAARKNANDARAVDYAGQQALYDQRNPHKNKEAN
jgi:hypothetical protein